MKLYFVVGACTCLTGIAIILYSTDFFNIKDITIGELFGAAMLLVGMARLKNVWVNRHVKKN